ncbi:MAG: DNA-3-methyladenine glycosylase I [Hyphomonadaceae bacterium]|nr:DNA-3-methyladenine glycosylase I [Hyphomonadaceae bacterium]
MPLRKFSEIQKLAEKHHGKAGLAKRVAENPKPPVVKAQKDDRWLASMSQAVFSAGFSWAVIEKKWPGFEDAFERFDPHRVAFYADRDVARLLEDTRIVRNGAKIQATINNAQFVIDTAKAHGSFTKFLKAWPVSDQIGLMEHFKKNASHMGPSATMYFLRLNGWDSFILSPDVTKALIREKVVAKAPTSKADMKAVQAAFTAWAEQSGLPQRDVSRILSFSVGPSA